MPISLSQHREQITKRIIASFTDEAPMRMGLSAFFPTETTIEKMVGIEVERNRQLIAVDVQRCTDANRNKFTRSAEKLFIPPMYLESWDFTECQRYDVTFGQRTNPSTPDSVNMIREANGNVNKMRNKIMRSIEKQMSEALQTGVVQLTNGDNINYNRKAASMPTLSGADLWDASTGTPLDTLATGAEFIREEGLSAGGVINAIFGKEAFTAFMNNAQVKDRADFRRISRLEIGMPQFDNTTGMVFHGQIGTADYMINLWTYNEFYETDAGVKTKYIDAKNVILIPEDFVGRTAYAGVPAIMRDTDNAEFTEFITPVEADFYLNNWLDKAKKAHWFELASAPLAIPVSIDRLYTVKVLA